MIIAVPTGIKIFSWLSSSFSKNELAYLLGYNFFFFNLYFQFSRTPRKYTRSFSSVIKSLLNFYWRLGRALSEGFGMEPCLMGNKYIIFNTIQYLALSQRKIQISLFVSGFLPPTLSLIRFSWLSVGLTVLTKLINSFPSLLRCFHSYYTTKRCKGG